MRFLVGFLVGLLGLAAYVGYERWQRSDDPCADRCAGGTRCVAGRCAVADPERTAAPAGRGPQRRRRGRVARPPDSPAPRKPSAADLRPASEGPALGQTERIDLAEADSEGRELSTAEVTAQVRRLDGAVVACIDRARGDYEIERGRVEVGFRIERTGRVQQVRVVAPALLLRAGLHGCLRPLFAGLRFPATRRALIMTFPYALE